jgi:predicted DNA-binding protein with PD1-like motif
MVFDEVRHMKFSEARLARIFVLRLEDGEDLHGTLEQFAEEMRIDAGAVLALGGAADGSRLVVGPEDTKASPINPMKRMLNGVNEISGVGTLVRDEKGKAILHMHVAAGRGDSTAAGCTRAGVNIWQVAEVVVFELVGSGALRKFEEDTGFVLLDFE